MPKKTLIILTVVGLVALFAVFYFVFRKSNIKVTPPTVINVEEQKQILLRQRLSEAMAIKEELARPKTADLSYIKDPEQRKKVADFIEWYNSPKKTVTGTTK